MSDVNQIPMAINWHEGMMLLPHHFQQNNIRTENLVHYQAQALHPFPWGVLLFEYDRSALINGVVRILELEAIMPDGLEISYDYKEDERELKLDLNTLTDQFDSNEITVHLAIAAFHSAQVSIDGELTRFYSIEGQSVTDDNTGDNEVRIPRLKPQLILMVSDNPPKKYVSLPLIRLRLDDEAFINDNYIPPLLRVKMSSPLGEIVNSLVQKLREKAMYIAEKVRNSSAISDLTQILDMKLTILALTAEIPYIESILSSNRVHPFELYQSLCSVLGKLAIISPGLIPPILPPYQHLNIKKQFDQLRDYINHYIEEGISEAYSHTNFKFDNGLFFHIFFAEWFGKTLILGIKRKKEQTEQEVAAWLEQSLIGSESIIKSLREKRILGVERKRVTPTDELIGARNMIYFIIKPKTEYVIPGEHIQVVNISDKTSAAPAEIVLFIKNK